MSISTWSGTSSGGQWGLDKGWWSEQCAFWNRSNSSVLLKGNLVGQVISLWLLFLGVHHKAIIHTGGAERTTPPPCPKVSLPSAPSKRSAALTLGRCSSLCPVNPPPPSPSVYCALRQMHTHQRTARARARICGRMRAAAAVVAVANENFKEPTKAGRRIECSIFELGYPLLG